MMLTTKEAFIIVFIVAVATLFTRAISFIVFPDTKTTPKYIAYLGSVLPYAVIGMLIVYCLKDVKITSYPYGLPEIASIIIVSVLHIWKKNTLLSIGAGTVLYMLFVQFVFI